MMNEEQTQQRGIPFDAYTQSKIAGTAKTAGIAALISLTGAVVGVIGYLKKSPTTAVVAKEGFGDKAAVPTAGESLFSVIISLLFSFMLFYLLNRFATNTRKGLEQNDILTINKGMTGLISYFKIIGILLVFSIGLAILGSLAGGLGAGFK